MSTEVSVDQFLTLLSAYVDEHPTDGETSFALVRLLYGSGAPAGADREAFLRYARAHVAAARPGQALVAEWIKAVEAAAR